MTSQHGFNARLRSDYSQVQNHDDFHLEGYSHGPASQPQEWTQHFRHEHSHEALVDPDSRTMRGEHTQRSGTSSKTTSTEYNPVHHSDGASSYELSKPQKSLRRRSSLVLGDWIWEFAAALLSFASIAAAIVVLSVYHEKSLAKWNFIFNANLNTIIAILSTLSRTALLVPVASCISQLKWIHLATSTRPLRDVQTFEDASRGPWGALGLIWRLNVKSKLATWGSCITILTLAMGPFAQQLVSYPTRVQFANDATFYSAQIYDSGTSRRSTSTWQLDMKMDSKMQGAIVNGLFNLSAPVQFLCPTGNCQWKEYTTFGVSSSCTNVTQATTVTCSPIHAGESCNYTTPGGFNIRYASSSSSGGGSAIYYNTTVRAPLESSFDKPVNTTLSSFALATFPYTNYTTYSVAECSMLWTARTVSNTTVVNGTFNPGESRDHELNGVKNPFESPNSTPQWDSFNVTDRGHEGLPSGTNMTFSISPRDNINIKNFLATIFQSKIGDPFGLALLNSTDIAKSLEMISTSMTYFMGRSPSGQNVTGESITSEQYIRVHWPWIIVPVLEVCMAVALLICTLIHTSRKGVVAWKSSGIVPLLTVMDGWEGKEMGGAPWRELERRSRGMAGIMVEDEHGVPYFRRAS